MLAGNLLPPQILLIPVVQDHASCSASTTRSFALIAVQVGFGLGFYTFVLHGFMRDLPHEIYEAATIDGAGDLRIYCGSSCRCAARRWPRSPHWPRTWIFNDLLWALTVLRTETKFPITAALLNLQGGYTSQWNVVAAGSVIAAIPTAIVFFAFQRQFVSGLLVGSSK